MKTQHIRNNNVTSINLLPPRATGEGNRLCMIQGLITKSNTH